MNIRIAINPDYGSFHMPKEFQEEVTNQDRNFRLTVADCIDKIENTHDKLTTEIYENLRNTNNNEWYIKSNNHFYFRDSNDEYNCLYHIEVVDVDTSKQWKISEYDGAEDIVYFTKPVVIDKKINMCDW